MYEGISPTNRWGCFFFFFFLQIMSHQSLEDPQHLNYISGTFNLQKVKVIIFFFICETSDLQEIFDQLHLIKISRRMWYSVPVSIS